MIGKCFGGTGKQANLARQISTSLPRRKAHSEPRAVGPRFTGGIMQFYDASPGVAALPADATSQPAGRWTRACAQVAALVVALAAASPLFAAEKNNGGSTSRQVREEAVRSIPISKLPDDLRPKVQF